MSIYFQSSLLQGLVGEMRKTSGEFAFGGRVAYCPQTAWIQNSSLRNNILFGRPFDEDKYWKVLERACLIPDLQVLPDGDLTEVGVFLLSSVSSDFFLEDWRERDQFEWRTEAKSALLSSPCHT